MAKQKYRLSYKVQGTRRWHNAPMCIRLEAAIIKYRFWEKRPEDDVFLTVSSRDENGDWMILDEAEFGKFKEICMGLWTIPREAGGMPEVKGILRHQ